MSCPLMLPTCSEFSCLVVFPLLTLTELFNPKANRFSGRSPRRNSSRRRQSCRRQARSQTDGVARDRARRDAGGNGTAGDIVGARGITRDAYGEGIRVGENDSGASDGKVAGRGRTAAKSKLVVGHAVGDQAGLLLRTLVKYRSLYPLTRQCLQPAGGTVQVYHTDIYA